MVSFTPQPLSGRTRGTNRIERGGRELGGGPPRRSGRLCRTEKYLASAGTEPWIIDHYYRYYYYYYYY